jgi:hypothetical protein
MRVALLFSILIFAVGAIMIDSPRATAADAATPSRLLRHVVLYKFKDDLTAAQLQEVVDAFCALPKKIDTIAAFERGTNVSPEGKSEGLTHAFVVSFRDEQGRDAYLKHPAHLEYIKLAGPRREKVVVFDYWSSE